MTRRTSRASSSETAREPRRPSAVPGLDPPPEEETRQAGAVRRLKRWKPLPRYITTMARPGAGPACRSRAGPSRATRYARDYTEPARPVRAASVSRDGLEVPVSTFTCAPVPTPGSGGRALPRSRHETRLAGRTGAAARTAGRRRRATLPIVRRRARLVRRQSAESPRDLHRAPPPATNAHW